MICRIVHRVSSVAALDFWSGRLTGEGVEVAREPGWLRFADPEGMGHELAVTQTSDEPLIARSTEVPAEFALQGFEAVHALVADPARSETLLRETLDFSPQLTDEHDWQARGEHRGGRIVFEQSDERGIPGAGTVHHIAWSVERAEQEQWRQRLIEGGLHPTPIIDRFYFESVYFREPGGILYELATRDGAGFAADESPETLGEKLSLPPRLQPMRQQIEPHLTPLPDTSQWRAAPTAS
jgi:glyoxalase family protein